MLSVVDFVDVFFSEGQWVGDPLSVVEEHLRLMVVVSHLLHDLN